MQFTDKATLSGTRETADGFLVAEAFAVRTGIQLYKGSEVGLIDRDVVRVYRPEAEVRSPASLQSFSHAPITLGHPSESVTADNWSDLAKGEVSTEAVWHEGKIKLPLIVKDREAIEAINGGVRELSAGYTCELEFADGFSPEGHRYDATQRNIKFNHLAIVPKGRAGKECRIGDGSDQWGLAPIIKGKKGKSMSDLKLVVLGDSGLNLTLADATILETYKAGVDASIADAQAGHEAELAAKDVLIATADAARDEALSKVVSAEDLDKLVADRADLVDTAKRLDPNVTLDGKSNAEIRKAVVVAKVGDSMADKGEAYIGARFDGLVEALGDRDPFAESIKGGTVNDAGISIADKAYLKNIADLEAAHLEGEAA